MNSITTKRMLFISPQFFGYERDIQAAFEKLGLEVDFIDERPNNSAIARAAVRVYPRLMAGKIDRHYKKQEAFIRSKVYDYVFLLKGEVIPDQFIQVIRDGSPDARYIFYTYDSLSNTRTSARHLEIFDQCWTIDYEDADRVPKLGLLPLFYAKEFHSGSSEARAHDVSFVGTVHSGRYEAIRSLFSQFGKVYSFFYCPALWYFLVSKYLVGGDFRGVRYRDVSFGKLSRDTVAGIFRDSVAVADIQRHGQTGLTMRTFEVLASGAALITTNKHVRQLGPEINKKVLVLDEMTSKESQDLAKAFVNRMRTQSLPPVGMSAHSVDEWAKQLLTPI